MIYFLILTVGAIVGFAISAILTAGSHSDDLQEAYHQGFQDGKSSVLSNVNNLYDKYKEQANEHNSN